MQSVSVVKVRDSDWIKRTYQQNYSEWGPPLTLSQYQERENRLASISDLALQCWAVEPEEPENTEATIPAHLETYKRPIKCWLNGNDAAQCGYSFGVASVFVHPEYRGRGMGTKMMKALKKELCKDSLSFASHLYSDIGNNFYSRLGWEIHSPWELTMKCDDEQDFQDCHGLDSSLSVSVINDVDVLGHVIDHDEQRIHQEMQKLRASYKNTESENHVYVWLPLDVQIFLWFRERTCVFAEYLYQHLYPFQRPFGFHVESNHDFIILFHDLRYSNLFVLRHSVSTEESARVLLKKCVDECRQCKLDKLVFWNPETIILNTAKNMLREESISFTQRETESLPSLQLFPDNIRGLNASKPIRVHWLANEKYCWI